MAQAATFCTCTITPAWMQRARTEPVGVRCMQRITSRTGMSPVRGLVLADASQLTQGVPTYYDSKAQVSTFTGADGAVNRASKDQPPSLWSLIKSALRVAAMFGVAVKMLLGNTNPAFATPGGDKVDARASSSSCGSFSVVESHDGDYKLDIHKSLHNTTVTNYYITINNSSNNKTSKITVGDNNNQITVNSSASGAAALAPASTSYQKQFHETVPDIVWVLIAILVIFWPLFKLFKNSPLQQK